MVGSDSNGDNKGNWYSFQHDDWVISTRAEHHVCHDIDLLKNVRCVQGFALTLPNASGELEVQLGSGQALIQEI
ncbi:hypothetical protein L6452_40096 [Arctium lappa]|uniref:Uncharacterized protein n=1 Tax=Arctium lappa TaxID=4217 RepID=A0ACB8XKW6_ARCLA|nr:hypothetical protein L6452_40096 [Arctium lappa]